MTNCSIAWLPRKGVMGVAFGLVALNLSTPEAAWAGRNFTLSYDAIPAEKGEREYEQWVTWHTDKEVDSSFDRWDFRHELEFGVTERYQLGLYIVDWRHQNGKSVEDETEFRDVAVENIYHLTDPRTRWLGSALYGEIKFGDELLVLEPKVILQKNLGSWMLVWNGTLEAEWEKSDFSEDKGKVQQTFGASYGLSPNWRGGLEVLHEKEYEDWEEWRDHVVYAGPMLRYKGHEWWATLTATAQATEVDEEADFLTRLIFGIEF